MDMKLECIIHIEGETSVSMYHYPERREMQFDIGNRHDKIVANIGIESAKQVRDRLTAFLKFHNQE